MKLNLDFLIRLRYHLPHLLTLIQMRGDSDRNDSGAEDRNDFV